MDSVADQIPAPAFLYCQPKMQNPKHPNSDTSRLGNYGFPGYNPEMQEQDDPQKYQSGWNPPQGASGLTSPVDNTGTQEPRSSSQQYSGRNPILGASQSPFANHPSRQASTATPSWKGQKRPRRQNSACVTCCQGKRACVRPEDDSEKTCKRCTQLSIECKPQTANSKREFRDANKNKEPRDTNFFSSLLAMGWMIVFLIATKINDNVKQQ